MPTQFSFSANPHVRFGAGVFNEIASIAAGYGRHALAITGQRSSQESGHLDRLSAAAKALDIQLYHATVAGEPSPEAIDTITRTFMGETIDVVIGLGGGSALDAAKAVAAMLTVDGPAESFLEGVGTRLHPGTTRPMIAVPTTAGTGSEATKNAVLSTVGAGGYKKSLRHDNFVPSWAVIDPELTLSCPPAVTAACGLDALTQLLEAAVSTKGSPMTDALALDALRRIGSSLLPVATDKGGDLAHRGEVSYAAYISGVALANAGLGVIHGLASPIGARIAVPHGVVCGTLLVPATRLIVEKLAKTPDNPGMRKYARAAAALTGVAESNPLKACESLVDTLSQWVERLPIEGLASYGFSSTMAEDAAAAASNKNTPVALDADDRNKIVKAALQGRWQ